MAIPEIVPGAETNIEQFNQVIRASNEAESRAGTALARATEASSMSQDAYDAAVQAAIIANAAYHKPAGGIPKTDLDTTVQASLTKADVSYQKPISGIPKTDLATTVQTSLGKADTALQSVPDATATVKGIASLGATGGAARYGQSADVGLGNVANERQYSATNPQTSVTGNAGTATRLASSTQVGSASQPVYFVNGQPQAGNSIPTVNNSLITINQGGVTKGTFTLNQATPSTISLDAGGGGEIPQATSQTLGGVKARNVIGPLYRNAEVKIDPDTAILYADPPYVESPDGSPAGLVFVDNGVLSRIPADRMEVLGTPDYDIYNIVTLVAIGLEGAGVLLNFADGANQTVIHADPSGVLIDCNVNGHNQKLQINEDGISVIGLNASFETDERPDWKGTPFAVSSDFEDKLTLESFLQGDNIILEKNATENTLKIHSSGGGGGTTNHAALSNLDYANSGHTGFATAAQGAKADTAYQKPATGVPQTDLASGVQTSLGKADTAYQKPATGVPKTDLVAAVQTSLGKADTALQPENIKAGANVTITPSGKDLVISAQGGGGTTGDFNDLINKPKINGVELVGNKSTEDIKIGEVGTNFILGINSFGGGDPASSNYNFNTTVGEGIFRQLGFGADSTAFGYYAGSEATISEQSTFIGTNANPLNSESRHEVVIGANARGHGDNTVTIGDPGTTAFYVGDVLYEPGGAGDGTTVTVSGVPQSTWEADEKADVSYVTQSIQQAIFDSWNSEVQGV